jgi:hypothetical protein
MPGGNPHIQGTDKAAPPPRRDLVDDQLLEEIELLGDVITRVAGHGSYLSSDEVDSVLGLPSVAHRTFRVRDDIVAQAADPAPTVRIPHGVNALAAVR